MVDDVCVDVQQVSSIHSLSLLVSLSSQVHLGMACLVSEISRIDIPFEARSFIG